MITTLKGLYYYFKYSNRLIIPLTKNGWKTLLTCASSWKDGVPEPIQFGIVIAIDYERSKDHEVMLQAVELLNSHYDRHCEYLAAYSFVPKGDKKIVSFGSDDLSNYAQVGWKATFFWSPVCG